MWFAKHYVDADPESLQYPDGPGDGGIDIASVVTVENQTTVQIFQIGVPELASIAEGRLIPVKSKIGDDTRRFRNVVTGKAKKLKELNPTARDVLRMINQARELAMEKGESEASLRIEIHPLSLKRAHPDARREIADLGTEATQEWSGRGEAWIVRPLKDVFDLYKEYQRLRPRDQSPEELVLKTFGEPCKDHPDRGPVLAFVSAADFVAAYEKWGPGLLDSNLRYSLGNTPVNTIIEAAAQHGSAIKWFHERNNGVVLTCSSFRIGKGQIKLQSPQIVNGGQTIHSIAKVLREFEEIPPEQRSADDQRRLQSMKQDMRLSARIVVTSGGGAARADEIALASNTQNRLSERTMRSSRLEMRDLRLRLARADPPWFIVTKDGEWNGLMKNKPLFQSRTGHVPKDFAATKGYRRAENTDLGVALLAFCGFVSDAKVSRVYGARFFDALFGSHVVAGKWQELSRRRAEWGGDAFNELFETGQSSASIWLIAYFIWSFWREFTYPESKQLILAYEEAGRRDPKFTEAWLKNNGWDVSEGKRDELLKRHDSCYWSEQVAKSAYLVLVYQSMRVLFRAFGELDDGTCAKILGLRQIRELAQGDQIGKLQDFRNGSLTDGPLTAIGRILWYACSLIWTRYESQIRNMASRQQVFLQEEWIAKFSEQIDDVCDRVGEARYRHAGGLEGTGDQSREFIDLRAILVGAE